MLLTSCFSLFTFHSNGDAADGTLGYRFTYVDVPHQGGEATVICSEAVSLFIAYRDHTEYSLEYEITTTAADAASGKAATGRIHLHGTTATKPVQGKAVGKNKKPESRRNLKKSDNVDLHDADTQGIAFDSDGAGNDVVLVQVEVEGPGGGTVYRSIVAETVAPDATVATLALQSANVNDEGDLELSLKGMPTERLLLKALVTVELHGKTLDEDQVEVSTMTDSGTLVVQGGWIRRALEKAGNGPGSTNGWKVYVVEAVALDPEANYAMVAQLSVGKKNAVVSKNKQLLANSPSDDERNISERMKMGKPPADHEERKLRARQLNTGHKKILVHGYW